MSAARKFKRNTRVLYTGALCYRLQGKLGTLRYYDQSGWALVHFDGDADGDLTKCYDANLSAAPKEEAAPPRLVFEGVPEVTKEDGGQARIAEFAKKGDRAMNEKERAYVLELAHALNGLWTFTSGLVAKHGMDGDDTLTDEEHKDWQDEGGRTNHVLGQLQKTCGFDLRKRKEIGQ